VDVGECLVLRMPSSFQSYEQQVLPKFGHPVSGHSVRIKDSMQLYHNVPHQLSSNRSKMYKSES